MSLLMHAFRKVAGRKGRPFWGGLGLSLAIGVGGCFPQDEGTRENPLQQLRIDAGLETLVEHVPETEACGDLRPAEIRERYLSGRTSRCISCHVPESTFDTALNLTASGLQLRMVDQTVPASVACGDRVLVPIDDPLGGLLVEKVDNPTPSCGQHMPFGAPADEVEIACIKRWAQLVAEGVRRWGNDFTF